MSDFRYVVQIVVLVILLISNNMCSQTQGFTQPLMEAFPQLMIKNDSVDMEIVSMQVNVQVMANLALTTYDITFFNPAPRVLEGELTFPLKANQQVVGFAMDVNGQLRQGVVVEKDKGRQVFETIVREGIDPGLLEKTSGNNFRLRIYPIQANGTKRVQITCQEEMADVSERYIYQLPMQFSKVIDDFSIKVEVFQNSIKPKIRHNDFANIHFKRWDHVFVAEAKNQKVNPNGWLEIELPTMTKQNSVLLSGDHRYFYGVLPVKIKPVVKEQIDHIHLLWDVSGSGSNRDIMKELDLLSNYLKYHKSAKVTLSTFNHHLTTISEYRLENGQADALINHIKQLSYDGGSRLDNINLDNLKGDEIILITDGLVTLGDIRPGKCTKPLIAINTSVKANHLLLRQMAESSKGVYIDLSVMDVEQATKKIIEEPVIVTAKTEEGNVNNMLSDLSTDATRIIITGELLSANARIALEVWTGDNLVESYPIAISETSANNLPIARLWATRWIQRQMMDVKHDKSEIITLAKKFGVVTDYTSLLVLERVEDYVRFNIEPPAELKEQFDELVKQREDLESVSPINQNDDISRIIKEYKEWWNTNFPVSLKKEEIETELEDDLSIVLEEAELEETPAIRESSVITRQEQRPPPPPPTVSDVLYIAEDSETEEACDTPPRRGSHRVNQTTHISVNTVPWDSTATYMSALTSRNDDEVYDYYLSVKNQYPTQPSFYLDVASYLFKIQKNAEAVSVVTNVVELQIENAETYRLAAHKLLKEGYVELAILLFEKILEMRPEDLQSYRDLALSYQKSGRINEAAALLVKALDKNDLRGNYGIKGIMLNELNCMVHSSKSDLLIDSLKKDWLYNMPVDIRIVLSWSTDYSDVDLWIVEPSGEKCFYKHKLTRMGGRISQDITGGFGPEEYCIKKAQKGTYRIQANYFGDNRQSIAGPVTLHAEIFRNYGTAQQTSQQIVLQLKNKKQVVDLGAIEVK